MKEGILIINKPSGMTSHDVVDFVRKRLKIKQVGHAGTLDPMATGVLIVLVGRYTKLFKHFLKFDKEYVACLTLGIKTNTGDSQGEIICRQDIGDISEEKIKDIFSSYTGQIIQIPPMVSAIRHKGERLYELARRGIEIERSPRKVTIKQLRLLEFDPPNIKFYLNCSTGTYVRQLGEDIARDLGSVGYISEIQRHSVGPYSIEQAIFLSQIDETRLIRDLLIG
ncbi:MAG: tRNA pseudouridine(55) synthase TruB [Candidatus Omnitrophica bacterium]|nr:tRNA pseudouridine(55) synthase TruB [Candidatus Omnitrophota bacterium]